ncbi:catalase [Mesorhizobium sp. M4B.F.Ca.ET.190.01.1.1]|uniref:catalase n=1 Tax=Mesorhizobium TaxID=68287 RepID=UPI000FE3B3E4|nr:MULTISPECIES: catalase [unclassified Mesorhizobium]RWF64655.1 MAG: catalase [Mesorhizobium sp.]RWX70084.1 catalase [Mesorhizobium sp. M4B.F.Ca.ET.089.01.1.1]TGQ37146.1 catalase [Mesorhizobium sp. M4B.F.Ca.ET.214.01.1.1]TGQ59441.1 catalase [Mesorhizobium sp. M4B.F.Ca.ET.211.01.1.1]TGR15660.1 catalase [Mesorhizobium sp. M4B.F.Ca.ET.200.01.1.1]
MVKTAKRPSGKSAIIHDQKLVRGNGGELHQIAGDDNAVLTTAQGGLVSDDQNSLRIGERGPTVLEDFHFREKIFHFDHERIPERVVHARGYGAHGYFETYDSLAKYTRADIFQRAGEKTPAFVRFSTVAGSKGSFDLARDVRGFAVKLYTKEGNWDIVGNNIPVFFIQDAIKFPDMVHAVKEEPDRAFPQAQSAHDNFWDFISLTPESMHMIMWVMSDRAIPRSFRFMEGFGVHTFRFLNAKDESTFVKFHWKPKLGLQSVVWNEAVKINGADPDFHRRDLWQAIQSGNFPEWELRVQLFDQAFADSFAFDVLDPTKIIPEEELEPIPVGRLVLDRMPDNFFAETEQVAFMTQNVPPGVDFSNDPLLQGRNFSYLDTQLKRLGSANFTHIPINAPKCPFHHFQQDGHMAMRNPVGRANYQPNSFGEGPRESPQRGFRSFADAEEGQKVRLRAESFADHYSQARQFFNSQTPPEQRHIAMALTFELSKVETPVIRERMVSHLLNIDEGLGVTVAGKLGIQEMPKPADAAVVPRDDLEPSPALSIIENGPDSFAGRKVGVLVSSGTDAALLKKLQSAIEKEGATIEVVAPKVGGVEAGDGSWIEARHMIDGGPSVLFDAIAVLLSEEGADRLARESAARDFVADAFAHLKFIAFVQSSSPLFVKAGVATDADEGLISLDGVSGINTFVQSCRRLRLWGREPAVKL